MVSMLIIADENIPGVDDAFSAFGKVRKLHGRHMKASDVKDAEVLLVRSITEVNEELLSGSKVKFVGSATIGTNHVDLNWLQQQGIRFSNAPGCNAVSAAEYVLAAVLKLAHQQEMNLTEKTVGIIGCGNVGSRVKARFDAMGITCLVCDPPRAEKEGDAGFVDMQAISRADIITVHVPLVTQGRHPTLGLLDAAFISQLSPGSTVINTSRGDVMNEQALKQRLIQQADLNTVLDVWENEPAIDAELVALASIATPHIAGYSTDGKLRATGQLHDAYSHFIKQQPVWDYHQALPDPAEPIITLQDGEVSEVISEALSKVYDITRDDSALRLLFEGVSTDAAAGFDLLRKQYPVRRECSAYGIRGEMLSASVRSALQVFGFGLI